MRPWEIPFAYLRMFETAPIIVTIISRVSSVLDIMSESIISTYNWVLNFIIKK